MKENNYNKENLKKYYLKNREKILENSKKYYLENKKRILVFSKKWREKNKEKCILNIKKWREKNKEKWVLTTKKWYKKNRKKILENSKKYYLENREKIINRNKIYNKFKIKTDINFLLKKRLRCRMRLALKNNTKSKKTMELLGVPHIDFFKTWLQSQFKEGMSWEKFHLIHIDHILPCSSFDLTKPEEQAKCFHYTNLQPLWASENLSKGNRIS